MASEILTTTADSSPAPETISSDSPSPSELTGEEYSAWRRTGAVPQRKKEQAAPAEKEVKPEAKESKTETPASPAEEAEEETEPQAETEAAAESQEPKPRKPQTPEERVQKLLVDRKKARMEAEQERKSRIALERQLSEEIRQLREEIRRGPAKEAKPEVQPQPGTQKPVRPRTQDFATTEEYEEAMGKYEEEKDAYYAKVANENAQKVLREAEQRRAQEEMNRSVAEKITAAKTLYEDFDAVTKPVVERLTGAVKGQQIPPEVTEAIGRSPHMAHILYVIGKDPEEAEAFLQMAQADRVGAILKVGLYEQLIKQELDKGNQSKPEPAKEETPPAPKVPAKQVTSAPKPAQVVAGNGAAPSDEIEQYVKEGDVGGYMRAQNQRELARRLGKA